MPQAIDKQNPALDLGIRRDIFRLVQKNPGCHFRELERRTGLPTGSIQYHLGYLVKKQLLKQEQDGKNVRYFPSSLSTQNKQVLTLLRQKSIRQILLYILKSNNCIHKDLVAQTSLSPSTVSWHLKKLIQENIIKTTKKGRESIYTLLVDKDEVVELLITYKESFVDKLVDNIIEMWE